MTFVKIYGTILDSSIWGEPAPTVKVWITMLAMADMNGFVEASMGGLCRRSAVTPDECIEAVRVLEAPDPDSKNPDHEGRRIERVERGWVILNHKLYRDMRTDAQIAGAERVRRHRERNAEPLHVTDVTAEAEVDVDTETTPPPLAHAHAQSPTGSSAQALVSIVPAEFRQDMEFLLTVVPSVTAWTAEMRASLDGMHGSPVTVRQLGQAVRDYVASGKAKTNPNLRSFRRFIRGVLEGDDVPHGNIPRKGHVGHATKLIQQLRQGRNQQFPNSISPTWAEGLTGSETVVVKPFLARIFADDPKGEGTLVAQLARALEEAE